MAEIAAAIDRASQSEHKPQIMDQPSQATNDQLRKDLMIEVSLAVRSVLANELPKMVRQAISDSLGDFIDTSANPSANDLGTLEAKPRPKGKSKHTALEKKGAPKKIQVKKIAAKKTKAKKN